MVGVGGVGRAFLFQLSALTKRLATSRQPTRLILIYIASSRKLLINAPGEYTALLAPNVNESWDTDSYSEAILNKLKTDGEQSVDLITDLGGYLSYAPGPVVIIDNTPDPYVADTYPNLLGRGSHIVTPNKKPFAGNVELWKDIQNATAAPSGGYLFHEATVGAGLPLLSTLTELVRTGDKIRRIEGVFSGTMSYLFNTFCPAGATIASQEPRWSEIVRTAVEEGYTEPDPRDDLDGKDVARKLTILARAVFSWEVEDVSLPIESLTPPTLEGCKSAKEFLQRLPEFDDAMARMKVDAISQGKVLRYVGVLDAEKHELTVGLKRWRIPSVT